jgi:hypothetical protein
VTVPTTNEGGGPAVAGGTEDPEGAFTSVDPWSAAPGPTAGACEKRRRFATSTTKAWWRRKSTPKMGKLTAAIKNCHWRGMPPMVTVKGRSPQQGIGPEGGAEDCHGMIENAEPVSTR